MKFDLKRGLYFEDEDKNQVSSTEVTFLNSGAFLSSEFQFSDSSKLLKSEKRQAIRDSGKSKKWGP